MSSLGNIGSFYMLFLIVLLIVGLGMLTISLLKYMFKPTNKKRSKNEGGNYMQSNNMLKLALFSFIGIIISIIVLGFLSPNNVAGNTLLGHQDMQESTYGSMYNMNTTSTGIIPMQNMTSSNMSGMSTIDSTTIMNNFYQMQMQINQMQLQMSQLQQMMSSMGNMQMQSMSAGSAGMSGMTMPASTGMTTTMPASTGMTMPASTTTTTTPDPAAAMSMPMM